MATPDDTEDFAALLAEYDARQPQAKRSPQVGESVRARVVSIGQEAIFLDVGGKAEATLDLAEVRDESGRLTVAVGDTIEARVVEAGGAGVVLRRTLGRGPDASAELEQAHLHGIPVEGLVTGVNKGGVEVQVGGVRAFCPISQLDLRHVEDAAVFVGQKLTFRITRYESGRGRSANIVLSRRALLEEEARARAVETRARLAPGALVRGTVTSVKDYGAFVDLGGLEGMLHVSELGFARVSHPRDVLSVGQVVDVQVLKIERGDDPKRPERISLSLKSLERDPWTDAGDRFPEGTRLRGTVVRVEAFGAFVELTPGIEGLVHSSELAPGRPVAHARAAVRIGQELFVTVLAVDRERRRISLALAAADSEDDRVGAELAAPPERASFGTLGDLLAGAKIRR